MLVGEKDCLGLTKREMEVLELILGGKESKEVAANLCISKRTVDYHLGNIYIKLNVSSRHEALSRLTRLGLVKHETPLAQ